jgi:diacylglycerol kinase family enzyme
LHVLSLADALFKASSALKSGDLMKLPAHQAFTQRNTKVSISPVNPKDKIYIEADGEVTGVLPAQWTIIPQSCQMIIPL